MPRNRTGLFTASQLRVMILRQQGLTQEEVAARLGTTRQNISIMERRAHRNLQLARETVLAYERLTSRAIVVLEPGTHRIDVPRLVVNEADRAGVRLRANFTRIYDEIHFRAGQCLSGTEVKSPITVFIFADGDIKVVPGRVSGEDEL